MIFKFVETIQIKTNKQNLYIVVILRPEFKKHQLINKMYTAL